MKTIIITGANSGLGFETAKKIAKDKNCRVILACRNEEKARTAKVVIEEETKNQNIIYLPIDTSSLKSVRNFVEEFNKLNTKLDVLICNAGISPRFEGVTEDGFELVFATNYLGHFLLTNLLIPYMNKNSRIIHISSDMHNPPDGLVWKDPEQLAYPKENDRKKYSYSKLCNLYFTYELDRQLRNIDSTILVNAFNPGLMYTNFAPARTKEEFEARKKMFPDRVGDLDLSSTALSIIAVSKDFNNITGKYFDRSTTYVNSSELSYNIENAKQLWEKSMQWIKQEG